MTNRFLAASVGFALSLGCGTSSDTTEAADATGGADTTTTAGDTSELTDVGSGTDGLDALAEDAEGADTGAGDGPDAAASEDVGTDGMTDAADIAEPFEVITDDAGGGADVEAVADVSTAPEVGVPDDVTADDTADAGPAPTGAGETCADAADLKQASEPTVGADFEYVLTGGFGASDDLNPFVDSGLPPACSIVYDAKGKEVVYAIDLNPGDILDMRYIVTPSDHPGGLYVLDTCDPTTWPDYDKSGKCGSNEYKSQGYCGVMGQCDPIDFNFLYPESNTQQKRFWIVLDEVAGDTAQAFTLYWTVIPAK